MYTTWDTLNGSDSISSGSKDIILHFVDCNTKDGRPKRGKHHFANRHAMLHRGAMVDQGLHHYGNKQTQFSAEASFNALPVNSLGSAPSQAYGTTGAGDQGACQPSSVNCDQTAGAIPFVSRSNQFTMHHEPSPHCDSSLLADGLGCAYASDLFDLPEVLRWYQFSQPTMSTDTYHAAKHHWADICWDWVRENQSFYYCIAMYAMIKKAKITGSKVTRQYLEFKVRALRQIQRDLATTNACHDRSITLLAIGQMSFCELQDANISTSATHLRVLSKLSATQIVSGHQWLYLSWIDLRHALIAKKSPTLPFFTPSMFRTNDVETAISDRLSQGRASRNVGSLPSSPTLASEDAYSILLQLHQIRQFRNRRKGGYDIPFGYLYKLDYQLRCLDARIWASQCVDEDYGIGKLFTAITQLHTFVLTRAWLPVRLESVRTLVRRSERLLHLHHDEITGWSLFTYPSFWLWVSFTVFALGSEFPDDINVSGIVKMVQKMFKISDIKRPMSLMEALCEWPLCTEWCLTKIHLLESLLFCSESYATAGSGANATSAGTYASAHATPNYHFVGAIEFYVQS